MLTIEDYSDKAIVLRGDTEEYKNDILKIKGKYNPLLKSGPGWIFPKNLKETVENFVKSVENGEILSEKPSKKINLTVNITKKEYLAILTRLERLELICNNKIDNKCDKEDGKLYDENSNDEKEEIPLRLLKKK